MDPTSWFVPYTPTEGHGFASPAVVGGTLLHCAAYNGNFYEVKRLICEENCSPMAVDRTGALPLHYACGSQSVEVVKLLMNAGHDAIYCKTRLGYTPLHIAAYAGILDVVKLLLDQGAKVNQHQLLTGSDTFSKKLINVCNSDSNTPLHFACSNGDSEIVELFTDHHADVNCKNDDGNTPLHLACLSNELAVVKVLVAHKSCDLNSQNEFGDTPLHLACQKGYLKISGHLIQMACHIDYKNKWGNTAMHVACKECDLNMMKLLQIAQEKHSTEVVGLVEKFLDTVENSTDTHNCGGHQDITKRSERVGVVKTGTDIHNSVYERGHQDVAKSKAQHTASLQGSTADFNSYMSRCCECQNDQYIRTRIWEPPLHLACSHGDLEAASWLIGRGFSVNFKCERDYSTPLHLACDRGHLHVVKLLTSQCECEVNILNEDKNTPLHIACDRGHLDVVKFFIDKVQCDLQSLNEDGNTALHLAIQNGHTEIVRLILLKAENLHLHLKNRQGDYPLHIASAMGHLDLVKLFTQLKADLNKQNADKNTPLHLACQEGQLKIVEHLLLNDSHVNLSNRLGNTPLHIACSNSHLGVIVNLLLSQKSCDVNCLNHCFETPLHVACEKGNLDIAKYLIGRGCDINLKGKHVDAPVHIACRRGHLHILELLISQESYVISNFNSFFQTPLHIACEKGDLDITKCLVERGFDINLKGECENAPIHMACYGRHLHIVKFLTSQESCDVNCLNRFLKTPLHIACDTHVEYSRYKLDMIKSIIGHKSCDINCLNSCFETPLHIACYRGDLDVAKCLVGKGCDVNFKGNHDNAPIHIACRTESLYMVEFIISQESCDVNSLNCSLEAPLHIACEKGNLDIVKCLVGRGCDINLKEKHGDAPVYTAWYRGYLYIVKFLLNQELCDVNCLSRSFKTPLHIACEKGSLGIVKCLVRRGCDINLKGELSDAPIHIALDRGYLNIGKFLISQESCNVNCLNRSFRTPIHIACEKGDLDLAKCLIGRGCDINPSSLRHEPLIHVAYTSNSHNLDILELLINQELCDVNCQNKNLESLLHIACNQCNFDVARCLVWRGCDVNLSNRLLNTPLHLACYKGYSSIVELLTSTKSCIVNCQNTDLETPLHLAINQGFVEISHHLFERGSSINLKNEQGDTPIHKALVCGANAIATLFIQAESCILTSQNNNGNTYLHFVCGNGSLNIARYLIKHEKGFDVSVRNHDGNAPIHIACEWGDPKIVELLTSLSQCDPNQQCRLSQDTPLHIACRKCHLHIVKILLSTGKVDPTLRNAIGKSAAEVTTDYTIIKEVSHYTKHKLRIEGKHPLGSYVQIFVAGDTSAGKTTLIEVLCRETLQLMKFAPKQKRIVTNVKKHTAGILSHEFHSRIFGSVVIYDFAGQHQYHTSHSAVVENSVTSSAPLFIIVIKMNKSDHEILQRTSYWLSFVENHANSVVRPHIIAVGSHADMVQTEDILENRAHLIERTINVNSTVYFSGFIALDCRKLVSRRLDSLRSILSRSCSALRDSQNVHFGCHALYAFLLSEFKDKAVSSVSDIISQIQKYKDILLPQTVTALIELLSAINNKGLLLLLNNPSCPEDGWVIFQKSLLISEVIGTLFAPEYFLEYRDLAMSTGVVPLSKIKAIFPQYDPNMIIGFLVHMELCQKIYDSTTVGMITNLSGNSKNQSLVPLDMADKPAVTTTHSQVKLAGNLSTSDALSPVTSHDYLQTLQSDTINNTEEYFLFPALIRDERPLEEVWKTNATEDYSCGWYLYCANPGQFLTSRFLHVLLLRLAFSFALAPDTPLGQDLVVLTRRCRMWKNGIQWLSTTGVESIIEVPEHSRSVVVMMRSLKAQVDKCAKLRSAVIQKVLNAKEEFCSKVAIKESFIHPTDLMFPFEDTKDFHFFSMNDIVKAMLHGQPDDPHFLIDTIGSRSIPFQEMLGFEPYYSLDQEILNKLFSSTSKFTAIQDSVTMEIAKRLLNQVHIYRKIINPDPAEFLAHCKQTPNDPVAQCFCLFKIWSEQRQKQSGKDTTCKDFREEMLDSFSILCGRNPLELLQTPRAEATIQGSSKPEPESDATAAALFV